MQHANSKTVTIFRAGSFLSRAQGKEIDDFFASSKKSIGSYWESVSSKKLGSGLTFKEESLLLPHLIDVDADDREFRKKVSEFYINMDTQVPHDKGRTLEIGLETSNTKEVSKDNMPLNISDFVRWKHAIGHPFVAKSKEEADGNALIEFYIFDKSEVIKKNTKKADERDAAMQIYLEIKGDKEKVDMMLTLLGKDPREFSGPEAFESKLAELRKFAESSPETFTTIHNEGDLTARYWIKTMINVGVIKTMGAKHFDAESDKLIGHNLEETLYYFNDEENSDVVVMLKSRAQESMKRPVRNNKVTK